MFVSGNYLYGIYGDYRTVAVETVVEMKNRPLKSFVYLGLMTTGAVLVKTNPNEQHLHVTLLEDANELMLVGDVVRNPKSDEHIQTLLKAMKDDRLRRISLGFFSFLYITQFTKGIDLYEAQCRQVKPHWTQFHKHIVDVGVFGKWLTINKAMRDFDINPEEWTEDGKPKNDVQVFQPFSFEEKK